MTSSDVGGTIPVEDGSSRSLYKNVLPSILLLPQLKGGGLMSGPSGEDGVLWAAPGGRGGSDKWS